VIKPLERIDKVDVIWRPDNLDVLIEDKNTVTIGEAIENAKRRWRK